MNKKKQSARITKLKAENYDLRNENDKLRFANEFLENRIAITEVNESFILPQMKVLTPIERKAVLIAETVINDCFKQTKQGIEFSNAAKTMIAGIFNSKKDFLKAEEVYFKALCKDDFNKVYAACPPDLLSSYANFRMDYDILVIGNAGTLYNTNLALCDTKNMTRVGIETFIKLLKNYKG